MTDHDPGLSTVYIVEDDLPFAQSVNALVRSIGHSAKIFSTAEAFLDEVEVEKFGCVILDLRLDGMSGVELLEEMRSRGYVIPVLFLTAYADVKTAVKSIHGGAIDFLEKPADPEMLASRIQQALQLDLQLRDTLTLRRKANATLSLLTHREQEVLNLVVKGCSSKQIAMSLQIAHKTVDKHRTSLMRKLKASNAAELVRFALEYRGISSETEGDDANLSVPRQP